MKEAKRKAVFIDVKTELLPTNPQGAEAPLERAAGKDVSAILMKTVEDTGEDSSIINN